MKIDDAHVLVIKKTTTFCKNETAAKTIMFFCSRDDKQLQDTMPHNTDKKAKKIKHNHSSSRLLADDVNNTLTTSITPAS